MFACDKIKHVEMIQSCKAKLQLIAILATPVAFSPSNSIRGHVARSGETTFTRGNATFLSLIDADACACVFDVIARSYIHDYSFCGYTTPGNRRVTERKEVRDRQVRDDWP